MRYSGSGLLSPGGHSQTNAVNLGSINGSSSSSNKSSANSKKSQSFIQTTNTSNPAINLVQS